MRPTCARVCIRNRRRGVTALLFLLGDDCFRSSPRRMEQNFMNPQKADILVIGAGPAGVLAALRAADLGAHTALLARDGFGGMAANDGPVPVRVLAHAARLIRDARQLGQYGVA